MAFGKIKITKEDALFSRLVRRRDKKCMRCGKEGTLNAFGEPVVGLQCSHFVGRGHNNTRFDFENCDALCTGCHSYWETHKATLYRDWKIEQIGLKRFKALDMRGRKVIQFGKFERAKKYEELKQIDKETK